MVIYTVGQWSSTFPYILEFTFPTGNEVNNVTSFTINIANDRELFFIVGANEVLSTCDVIASFTFGTDATFAHGPDNRSLFIMGMVR